MQMNNYLKCLMVTLFLSSLCLAEELTFTGMTDKNPLLYKCGEEICFTVTLVDKDNQNQPVRGRKLSWLRRGDDGIIEKGETISDKPLEVRTSIKQPGFVRLTVNVLDDNGNILKGYNQKFDGGAGADIDRIAACPVPDDFNLFWNEALKKLYATPYEVKLSRVAWPGDKRVEVFKFEITTFADERPVTGLLAYPTGTKPKSLPLMINAFGYGFGRYWIKDDEVLKGKLCLAIARHGEDPIGEKTYYEQLKQNEMKDFCFRNNDDKYQNDFYKMLIRDLRALQYAKTRPEWNGKELMVSGGSMGGFQAIGLAALDPAVTECEAEVPWLADLGGGSKFKRLSGWRPAFTETLRYFDTANLATLVQCPTKVTIGLGDYICPPSGQMILFRNLRGPKFLKVYQNRGHGGSPFGVKTAEYKFIDEIR